MRVAYVYQYFKTPQEAGSTRAFHICEELVLRGHEVVVITGRKRGQRRWIQKSAVEGMTIWSVRNQYSNEMGRLGRAWSFLKFMVASTAILLALRDLDVVFATSTPLSVAVPALCRKLLKRTPFVFEVRDLWPEALIQLGAVRRGVTVGILRALEKAAYTHAEHVIALSPGMRDGVIAKGIPPQKVSMIPNMAKCEIFGVHAIPRRSVALGKKERSPFRVVYFGALGISNDLDYLLDVAALTEGPSQGDIEYWIIGDGAEGERLSERAVDERIASVKFFGRRPLLETAKLVSQCHLSVVLFRNIPILRTNSPNKLFDSLSAGLPVVVNSDGWTRTLVEEAGCGLFSDPESPTDLATIIMDLHRREVERRRMGEAARRLAEGSYDVGVLCPQVVKVVEEVVAPQEKPVQSPVQHESGRRHCPPADSPNIH